MGVINKEVKTGVLKRNPGIEEILYPFLADFDVGWGDKRSSNNAEYYEFLMKPSDSFAETFGLEYELLMVYSAFNSMQARTMQAISDEFRKSPAKGRVENYICIVVSDDVNAHEWVSRYIVEHQDLRSYVVFSKKELLQHRYSVLSVFRGQLSERDLFDVQLPLLDDLYFFGRKIILHNILDNIRKCENSGVFGLRKTGKTSLLNKINRTISEETMGKCLMYDAKNVKIRMRSWTELLCLINDDICQAYGFETDINESDSVISIVEGFENTVRRIPKENRLILIFDEIEYISFIPPRDRHWIDQFFDFWQILWSYQSQYRNLCFIIAGVSAQVVEESSVNGTQNPLFSIVNPYYIRGLDRDDIHDLSRRIGRRMGLKFDNTAVDYFFSRYAGHPLLTRLALSYENRTAKEKPIKFSDDMLRETELNRENELRPYCQHIVDVLKDFYPEEYVMLEFLSIGDIADFMDLSKTPFAVEHLKSYGLLTYENNVPQIGIPVVSNYIREMTARQQGTLMAKSVVRMEDREAWLHDIVRKTIEYIGQLEYVIEKNKTEMIYGSNSFPDAHKLIEIPVVYNESSFCAFITTVSKCLVESIDVYGKSIGDNNYFWIVIKEKYPVLFDALLRIKVYRNWSDHLKLNERMREYLNHYLDVDLEGKSITDVEDSFFILQQCVMESLKLSISVEMNNMA